MLENGAAMADASGVTVAHAINHNRTLQGFSLDCHSMGDESGVAAADAINHCMAGGGRPC